MAQYWFARDGQKFGPYDEAHVRGRYERGEVLATDLVWAEGMPKWVPATQAFGPPPATSRGARPAASAAPAAASPYRPPESRTDRDPEEDEDVRYAGFWVRFAAAIVDGLVVGIPVSLVTGVAAALLAPGLGNGVELALAYLLPTAIAWAYFASMESGSRGATLGKRAFHLQVLGADGLDRVSFGRATGRFFGRYLSVLVLCIGYLMQPFTGRKQALHDLVSGTVVVARRPASTGLIVALVAFLFIGPVLVGILAAIALPAYQDYAMRARVAEALLAAQPARAGVHEYIVANDAVPRTLDEAGVRFEPTPRVQSITVDPRSAVLTVTLGFQPLAGRTILLVPRREGDGSIAWQCGPGSVPRRYLPASCRGQ